MIIGTTLQISNIFVTKHEKIEDSDRIFRIIPRATLTKRIFLAQFIK